jgi:hypothetical protein
VPGCVGRCGTVYGVSAGAVIEPCVNIEAFERGDDGGGGAG